MSHSRTTSSGQRAKLNLPLSSFAESSYDTLIPEVDSKSRDGQDFTPTRTSNPLSYRKAKESIFSSPIKTMRHAMSPTAASVTTANTTMKAFTPSPKKNHRLVAREGSTLSSKFPLLATIDTSLSLSAINPVRNEPTTSPRIKLAPTENGLPEPVPKEQEEPKFTQEEIREKLYRVFQFYTSFGERSNVGYLKSHRFHKMMVDGEVRDEWLNQISLDLLYVGELRNSGNLDFERFLNLLGRVAKVKFDGQVEEESEAYNLLIEKHMIPLYDRLFKFVENEEENIMHEQMEDGTKLVFNVVDGVLERIYKMYFPFEIQTGQEAHITRQKMENALFIFLRDFNICPDLINKGSAYAIWSEVLKSDSEGSDDQNGTEQSKDKKLNDKNLPLTMDKFKLFLMRVSNLGFPQDQMADPETILSQPERAAQLLERMDIAFRNLSPEKKALMPGFGKTSLLVAPDVLTKIMDEVKTQQINKKKLAARYSVKTNTDYAKYNITNVELIALYEENYVALIKIFQYYCSFGEPLNTTKLHAFKFNRLLREAGLLKTTDNTEPTFKILPGVTIPTDGPNAPGINRAEADIIVASVAGPKQVREANEKKMGYDPRIVTPFMGFLSHLYQNDLFELAAQGRLEYGAFLKAIEMVAIKLHPKKTSWKGVKVIIEKNLLFLEKEIIQIEKMSSSQPLKALVDLLQDIQMVQFLGLVHKSLGEYYKSYANSKGLMNIERFMQFCRDFGIFPDLVKKIRLQTFFKALAGVRADTEESKAMQNQKTSPIEKRRSSQPLAKAAPTELEEELVDQHMFVEAVVLCALDLPYLNPQPNDTQKIYNLLEKLNRSQGPVIVRMKLGVKRAVSGLGWDIVHEIRGKYPELLMDAKEEMTTEEKLNNLMGKN